MSDLELISFQVISKAGFAKSNYIEAMEKAEKGDYKRAEELIKEGYEEFIKAHEVHSKLVSKEASGDKVEMSLILTHAEDQLSSAEIIKLLSEQNIKLRKEIDKLNG